MFSPTITSQFHLAIVHPKPPPTICCGSLPFWLVRQEAGCPFNTRHINCERGRPRPRLSKRCTFDIHHIFHNSSFLSVGCPRNSSRRPSLMLTMSGALKLPCHAPWLCGAGLGKFVDTFTGIFLPSRRCTSNTVVAGQRKRTLVKYPVGPYSTTPY